MTAVLLTSQLLVVISPCKHYRLKTSGIENHAVDNHLYVAREDASLSAHDDSLCNGSKDIRYFLMGVLFVVEGAKLIAVATDTHRLAYCEAEIDGLNQETKIEAIVPRKTVRELLRILPEDDTPVTVNVGDTQIGFNFAGIEFVSKLIEGKFPDYQRVMPTLDTNPQCVSINREELLLALRAYRF